MRDTIGVLLAALGLGLAIGGFSDSIRFGAAAAGVLLLVGSVAVLIDLGG